MKTKIFAILLAIVLLVQFGVGLYMVKKHTEVPDKDTTTLNFKCNPVDSRTIFSAADAFN